MAWRVLRLRVEEGSPVWTVAANVLNKQSRTADKGWSSSLGVGRDANNSSPLKCILLRNIHRQSLRTWTDTLVRHKQRKREMRFCTCNVRSLYMTGSFKWDVGVWAGLSWLRIGTGGGYLWMRLIGKWVRGLSAPMHLGRVNAVINLRVT
jgi:hypothetical protein